MDFTQDLLFFLALGCGDKKFLCQKGEVPGSYTALFVGTKITSKVYSNCLYSPSNVILSC